MANEGWVIYLNYAGDLREFKSGFQMSWSKLKQLSEDVMMITFIKN